MASAAGHDPLKAVSPALPLAAKQTMKANSNAKGFDSTRKQQPAGSGDNQNRKAATPPPKAWQGANPITSRGSNTSTTLINGSDKPAQRASSNNTAMDAQTDRQAHDRLLFLLSNMTGLDATVTLKTGEKFSGVLSGGYFDGSTKSSYTLKMVKRSRASATQHSNGVADTPEEYLGEGEDHVVSFDVQDTLDFGVNNVATNHTQTLHNGAPTSSFQTDTEISSRTSDQPREKKLQRWAPEPSDMSLEDMAIEGSGANGWDQFKANEQKYGVSSTYDEDIYTTSIDRSHPQYARRLAEADKLAKEIESSASGNSHVAEERRQDIDQADDGDEEDKYSGVKRGISPLAKGSSGSYVPPSRRPLTNTPTVPGAPYDPAIISSQLARTKPAQSSPGKSDGQSALDTASSQAVDGSHRSVSGSTTGNPPKVSPSTTESHVRDTADAFKQFANNEKLRIRQAQEQKRTNARNEKNVRINDLKKFAENFKLRSRVPDDLVPILAKNHEKQQEIRRKAEEAAAQVEEQRSKEKPASVSPAPVAQPVLQAAAAAASSSSSSSSQQPTRQKPLQNRTHFIPQPLPGMSPRQAQIFKGSAARGVIPPQQPAVVTQIPTGPAAQTATAGPSSPTPGAKLNVNATPFSFRPGANSFMPSGTSPSPQRPTSAQNTPSAPVPFFDEKEKSNLGRVSDDSIEEDSNVILYLQTAGVSGLTEDQKKSLQLLGGVPQPYRTPPTWNVPQDRINTVYEDAYGKPPSHDQMPQMMHLAGVLGTPLPHAHQLPPHMHGNLSAQQARYFQQPGMPHPQAQAFDPRMQYSGVPGSSVQSSPRFPNAQVTIGQMPQFMGMPQFAGQPLPYAGMSPNMAFRQPHAHANGNPMMMVPGQSHGPMTPVRAFQQGGQHFTHNMPGQMMMQSGQPSPYASGQLPQQPYSPLPHNAQPHMQHMGQHPGQAGFSASPRPGPHMMHHTSSHQGYQPHQMGMPYSQMPPQPSPYAMNQRQMSAGHFQQMTPRQQQAIPAVQSQPSPSPAMSVTNTGKNDEGK